MKPFIVYSGKISCKTLQSINQSIKEEGRAEAKAEAEARKQREIALNFLRQGFPVDAIAQGTGLSITEVQQLQQQLNESTQN